MIRDHLVGKQLSFAGVLLVMLLAAGHAGKAEIPHQDDPIRIAYGSEPHHTLADLDAFLEEARSWLLAGETAPPDVIAQLHMLAPGDRILALAYMRRIGVYDGPAVSLELLLDAGKSEARP